MSETVTDANGKDVRIPTKAVSEGQDVGQPVATLLRDLNLLGKEQEGQGFWSTFTGPPQSVALIEAGATAASKWWATGLGAIVVATWGGVLRWWNGTGNPQEIKLAAVGAAAFVTAALIVAIGLLLASDVRGRALAAAATIDARARLAEAMIQAAQTVYLPAHSSDGFHLVPLSPGLKAKNYKSPSGTDGWTAVAMQLSSDGKKHQYVLHKGVDEQTVDAECVEFVR